MDAMMNMIASCGVTNTFGIALYEVDSYGEYVLAGVNNDKPKKYKLYETGKGYYFNFGRCRFYLHDFIRC